MGVKRCLPGETDWLRGLLVKHPFSRFLYLFIKPNESCRFKKYAFRHKPRQYWSSSLVEFVKKKIFSFKKIKKANFSGSCSRNKKRGMSHDVWTLQFSSCMHENSLGAIWNCIWGLNKPRRDFKFTFLHIFLCKRYGDVTPTDQTYSAYFK